MKESIMFLQVAKDEIETLIQYQTMLDETAEQREARPILDEIMGDEFNHALISLLTAAKLLKIKIATDDIEPNPNSIEVE